MSAPGAGSAQSEAGPDGRHRLRTTPRSGWTHDGGMDDNSSGRRRGLMAWVVDTSVLLDIYSADPVFAQASARCLAAHAADGLTLCPITYIELAPAFNGDSVLQEQFLAEV